MNEVESDTASQSSKSSRVWLEIVVANFVAGLAAASGWSVFTLAMLYWFEEVVAGLVAIVKLYRARRLGVLGSRTYKILFFIAHYATYCVLHFAVLLAVLGADARVWTLDVLWFVGFVAFVIAHASSYFQEYKGNNEYTIIPANVTLFSIYGRVAPAQMTVLLLIVILPTPWGDTIGRLTLLFIATAKTVLDLLGHYWEHAVLPRKYQQDRIESS